MSDTHGYLDSALFDYFADCDEIWHAGDVGAMDVLERLQAFKPVRAVYGNVDGPDLRSVLPAELTWTCEGVNVYMTHIGGYPGKYQPAARKALVRQRPDLFICGHSHILKIGRDPALGLLHFNPGACGRQGWHKLRTALRFSSEAGRIAGVEAIHLGAR